MFDDVKGKEGKSKWSKKESTNTLNITSHSMAKMKWTEKDELKHELLVFSFLYLITWYLWGRCYESASGCRSFSNTCWHMRLMCRTFRVVSTRCIIFCRTSLRNIVYVASSITTIQCRLAWCFCTRLKWFVWPILGNIVEETRTWVLLENFFPSIRFRSRLDQIDKR